MRTITSRWSWNDDPEKITDDKIVGATDATKVAMLCFNP
jgi:hypothetical protein